MEDQGALLNVVDVEATCWPGRIAPPGQTAEIIEIGVCVVDLAAGTRVARARLLVRPTRSRVTAFCTGLTGLTPEEVAGGLSFAAACARLRREFASAARPWTSWGAFDRDLFTRQCRREGVAYPFPAAHTDAKAVFAAVHGLTHRPTRPEALSLLGLPPDGAEHRASDDAWNAAALVLALHTGSHWPPPAPPDRTRDPAAREAQEGRDGGG